MSRIETVNGHQTLIVKDVDKKTIEDIDHLIQVFGASEEDIIIQAIDEYRKNIDRQKQGGHFRTFMPDGTIMAIDFQEPAAKTTIKT